MKEKIMMILGCEDDIEKAADAILALMPSVTGETSDGYHTFNELYEHRQLLFLALCHCSPNTCWWSRRHDDGTHYEGWVLVGLELDTGAVSYHVREQYLPLLPTAWERASAPKWDGHTPTDVIRRITYYIKEQCKYYIKEQLLPAAPQEEVTK